MVIGSGCSIDEPTNLPAGRQASREAFDALVRNNVLANDGSIDPNDLTAVADAAYDATKSNVALVDCLRPLRFENAVPNRGHLILAALLIERAVKDVLTLNYDLTVSVALAQLGAGESVASIHGPQHHRRLQSNNVIYLHGTARSAADEWVLTTNQLEESWRNRWQQLIAEQVAACPILVFSGMGSSAKALSEAAIRVKNVLPEQSQICYVNPSPFEECKLAQDMGLNKDCYVQLAWLPLADALGARLKSEQIALLKTGVGNLIDDETLRTEIQQTLEIAFASIDLVDLGQVRAQWLLHHLPYCATSNVETELLAHLLLGLVTIQRHINARIVLEEHGRVRLVTDRDGDIIVILGSGKGTKRYGAVNSRLRQSYNRANHASCMMIIGLVASTVGSTRNRQVIPEELVADEETRSVASAGQTYQTIDCGSLIDDPTILEGLFE